jgi:hypothetical protein
MLRKLGVDTSIPEPDLPITLNESAQKVKVLHPTQLQTQIRRMMEHIQQKEEEVEECEYFKFEIY